ncbi:MAG: hypothetical protein CML33_07415 [Rhodobacteraceae bacterium]|nr:hypothetical protein [Paracoccaceae bacterium]
MAEEEKQIEATQENDVSQEALVEEAEDEEPSEADRLKLQSDFALKLVDTVVAFNDRQISSYEIPNRFFTKDEVACFLNFLNAVPINPLPAIYPEDGFLIFRGVTVPKSVNLSEANKREIEQAMRAGNEEEVQATHLSDLEPDMLNSFQIATQIYNNRVEKTRVSYLANVKAAKGQVTEISAAVVCGFVIILTLASLT